MSKIIGIIPNNYDNKVLKMLFTNLQNILDNLTGAWLKDGSVTYSKLNLNDGDIPGAKLANRSVAPEKINIGEWHFPLSLPAGDVGTVSTSYVRCSGIFSWDPSKFPTTGGSWYFEASLAISNAGATVTAHLMGASEVAGSVVSHTGDTVLTPKRSAALTMPASPANLYVEFKTSNGSYQANFAGARLIFVPN